MECNIPAKVKKSGIIDIFGKNSTVSFNGLTNPLVLPQTFITVVPGLNVTEIGAKKITLQNLTITEPGEITVSSRLRGILRIQEIKHYRTGPVFYG